MLPHIQTKMVGAAATTSLPAAAAGNATGRPATTGTSIDRDPDSLGVLVIGGGISGLCLARALLCLPCEGQSARPRVVVVEQSDQPKEGRQETGTIDLTQRAVGVLRELDIDLPCIRDTTRNRRHGSTAATVAVSRSGLVAALRASLPPGTMHFNSECAAVQASPPSPASAPPSPPPALLVPSPSAPLAAVIRDPRTGQTSSLPERFHWAVAADGLVSRSRALLSKHSGAAATAVLLRRLLALGDAARVFRGEADFGMRRVRRGASQAIWQARDLAALLLLVHRRHRHNHHYHHHHSHQHDDHQPPSSAPGTRAKEEQEEEQAIAALRAYTMAAALLRNRLERAVPVLLVLLVLLVFCWRSR